MNSEKYIYVNNLENLVQEFAENSITSRTIHEDENSTTILFAFSPGQKLSEHTSSKSAILHFVKGKATITLENNTSNAVSGTWVHMQPNLPHSIEAETEVIMLLIMFNNKK